MIAIVNRRNSDLIDKADGVLYTSDGRDVEMSVASTKAFYAQVAAGFLLACAIAEAAGVGDRRPAATSCSPSLRELPDAMRAGARRAATRSPRPPSASRPSRRYWAVVGNGANRIAAEELRIKLSELCYKSIACDVTEDKKHIDLSSRAADPRVRGRPVGSNADDVAKEVAIYRAHKAAPIVIATEGEERFARRARRDLGAGGAPGARRSCCRRWPATCSATRPRSPSTRSARPLREARERDRGARSADGAPTATTLLDRLRADARAARASGSSTACAPASTTATSRPAPRCGSRRCCATPPAIAPLDALPGRVRQGRHAERAWSTTSPPRSRGRSRSSPGPSTRSSTRPRRSPSASPAPTRRCSQVAARARGARRRRGARPAQLPRAAHARRPRPGGRRGHRLHPLPHRGRSRRRRRHDRASSTAAASRATCRRAPSATRGCGAPSTASRSSAR